MNDIYQKAAFVLYYDQVAGFFVWMNVTSVRPHLRGKLAGSLYSDGYIYIRFEGKRLLAHRLAWVIATGNLPNCPIDHIDMNRANNSLFNLRLASVTENNRNRVKQSNNTSGYKGVTFHKGTGKYHAKICVNKQRISLGYFKSANEASLAYQQAAKEHHGEFARF